MAGLISSPSPPPPPPAPPPPVSTPDPAVQEAATRARRNAKRQRGRRATLLTGGLVDTAEASIRRATLLGG